MSIDCGRHEEVSAYLDGELSPSARREMEAHLASCPECSKVEIALRELRTTFRALPEQKPGFDLTPLIEERLARHRRREVAAKRWWAMWPLLPQSAAAVASVAGGLVLGSMMIGAASVATAPRVAVMAVFDAVPPGGLCLVRASCPHQGLSQ